MKGRVLIIAGSDSGGGAGIQADIKSVTALGGFASTAITALTAQNTEGVFGVSTIEIPFIRQQIQVVLHDIGADILKTGMLQDAMVIQAVCEETDKHAPGIPIVVDPVMMAKGGKPLLCDEAVSTLRDELLPRAFLITPNIPEAESLLDRSIVSVDDMKSAADALMEFGPNAVLVKGGHLHGNTLSDVLLDGDGFHLFEVARVDTRHTHGTGCTLASSIATGLAQGLLLPAAVQRAQAYVVAAIKRAPGFGRGYGPIDHGHTVNSFGVD